ncbi:hypothetical protein LLH23_10145 [bacterium]|nr:hypothetical protein [bacterium]
MADFTTGRLLASRYAAWALLNLLVGGPALALLSAYDAASDGTLNLQYPIFSTHCWLALMGWCVPSVFALVFWLFPILKEAPLGRSRIPSLCLLFLVLATLGLPAYLFLSHSGLSSLFILPVVWGLYLVAGILYALVVWQLTARTLRPTATDLGIQAGAVWLLLVLGARVVAALGAMASGRHEFLASSDAAIRLAMLFGFVGNTGLALAAAVAPSFLKTPNPRAMVLSSFRVYNAVVAIWCGGAAWVLPYPFSWGRLLLTLAGFGFAYGVLRLLTDLRLPELLLLPASTLRRTFTRTALATGAIMMMLAALVIALIGVWSAATLAQAPSELVSLPMHLMTVGFFANLVLALYVPTCGPRSMVHVKGVMAWGAYILLTAWLIAKLAVAILGMISKTPMWPERYLVGWTVGAGMVLLSLWLLSALWGSGRKRPPD